MRSRITSVLTTTGCGNSGGIDHQMDTMRTRYNPQVVQSSDEASLRREIATLHSDQASLDTRLDRGQFYLIRLDRVSASIAKTLRQAFKAYGGDAIAPSPSTDAEDQFTDVLLTGTWPQYQDALRSLHGQPTGMARQLAQELMSALRTYRSWPPTPIVAGDTLFRWGSKTYIMGIINVAPDSFSGDGLGTDIDAAVRQAMRFVEAGADLLDIGGESTRPGAEPISADVEIQRVLPAVQAIAEETDVPISVDTYKAEVASAALDAGAHIVNDVWGLRMDPDLAPMIAEGGVPVIVMHNRSRPKNAVQEERLGGRYVGIEYENLMGDVLRELRESLAIAVEAGIALDQIIVDPGIGFGKTVKQNLIIIDELDQLRTLGRPVLAGPSRKSFIGYTLDAPVGERLFGTAAAVAAAIVRGADIVRVHDVSEIADVVRMTDAITKRYSLR